MGQSPLPRMVQQLGSYAYQDTPPKALFNFTMNPEALVETQKVIRAELERKGLHVDQTVLAGQTISLSFKDDKGQPIEKNTPALETKVKEAISDIAQLPVDKIPTITSTTPFPPKHASLSGDHNRVPDLTTGQQATRTV